jgi:Icc-related predicted phosphoesterase
MAEPFKGPTVMVTHHGVHPGSVHKRFAGDPINPAFVSNLAKRIKKWKPTVMVHGHVHNKFYYRVGPTLVVANPRGYEKRLKDADGVVHSLPEHADFDPHLVVTV